MAPSSMAIYTALVAGILICGCAQPPPTAKVQQNVKTDFGSGIDLAVSVHSQPDTTIVVLDCTNLRQRNIRLWFSHKQETDGQVVSRSVRYYEGTDKSHREVFRVQPIENDIIESFWIEVFDGIKGALIIQSQPVINQHKEGRP